MWTWKSYSHTSKWQLSCASCRQGCVNWYSASSLLSMVRPHLEYASPVWSPHLAKDKELIESVQKFALRIASKSWSMPNHDLLIQI